MDIFEFHWRDVRRRIRIRNLFAHENAPKYHVVKRKRKKETRKNREFHRSWRDRATGKAIRDGSYTVTPKFSSFAYRNVRDNGDDKERLIKQRIYYHEKKFPRRDA